MGLLLFVGIVMLGLAACAPQLPEVVAGPETDIAAAKAARQLLGQQLHRKTTAVQIVAVEEETWPDACLGAPHADELCAQAQTPGYRITLEVDGRQYVYHTDLVGDGIRLAGAPEPTIGATVVTWFGSDEASCQTLEAGLDGVAFGRCGRPLLGVPYSLDSRQAELEGFSAKYAPFEAETRVGTIQFSGKGVAEATPAEQRMIAEWAHLIYQEAEAGRSDVSWGVALEWQREGGLAGFCDELSIYRSGDVFASYCGEQMPVDIMHMRLDAGQMEILYEWLDAFQPFEHGQTDDATADAMRLQLVFNGDGEMVAQDADKQAMLDFAQGLYNEAGMPAGGELEDILVQLDYEGGFVPPHLAVSFGRVPPFTLLADGRVLYVNWNRAPGLNQEQLLVAQLTPAEAEAFVQQVLDLGFERLESHFDQCQTAADGSSQCVADAGYSILRVRLADGQLREIRNWAGFANDPEVLEAIRQRLTGYSHPEAQPYAAEKASLFIEPMASAEGMTVVDWPLDSAWLVAPAPDAQQWAKVLAGELMDQLIAETARNMGTYYFQHDGQFYHVVLVPWLPGVNYEDEVAGYVVP